MKRKHISKTYVEWYLKKNEEPDENFLQWIGEVEKKITLLTNCTLLDLPDEDYMNCYLNKFSPYTMVKIIIESNGLK